MEEKKITEIRVENWKRINQMMDLRTEQFKKAFEDKWWENLVKDELYQHLCKKLVEIKLMGQPTVRVANISEEEIKDLASGFITVKDFMDIEFIDDLNNQQ